MQLSYHKDQVTEESIHLPYSKSILNRLIILGRERQSLKGSESINDDITAMVNAVDSIENNQVINAGEAGTVLRFALAKAANSPGYNNYIQRSPVLATRPIHELIELLQELGADIQIRDKKIWVKGRTLKGGTLQIEEQLSSQFISALMLIGHQMVDDLHIKWSDKQSSSSYIQLTAEVMRSAGIELAIGENKVKIKTDPNFTLKEKPIERDWSAASFFFALALLDQSKTIELFELQNHSKQAEHKLFLDLQKWGLLKAIQASKGIRFSAMVGNKIPKQIDFTDYPDAALNIMLCWALNGWSLDATGLQTLDRKESKRLQHFTALLRKLNVEILELNQDRIHFNASTVNVPKNLELSCHNDHRIAMAWALLATHENIILEGHSCVTKSFPYFWKEINKAGFKIDA
jgi:3-phosphoshikimate 1-carboxyvinyltransferase